MKFLLEFQTTAPLALSVIWLYTDVVLSFVTNVVQTWPDYGCWDVKLLSLLEDRSSVSWRTPDFSKQWNQVLTKTPTNFKPRYVLIKEFLSCLYIAPNENVKDSFDPDGDST